MTSQSEIVSFSESIFFQMFLTHILLNCSTTCHNQYNTFKGLLCFACFFNFFFIIDKILFLSNLSKLISWQMSLSFPNNNSKLKNKHSGKIENGMPKMKQQNFSVHVRLF